MKTDLNNYCLLDVKKTEEGTTYIVETNVIPKDFSIMSFLHDPNADASSR